MTDSARPLVQALVYAVVTAVVTLTLAFGLAALLGDEVEERTDRNTQVILREVEAVRTLICEALAEADNPRLVAALKEHCL